MQAYDDKPLQVQDVEAIPVWPQGIKHSDAANYDIANGAFYQISPLDHAHVVHFDPIGFPNASITLQLPVLTNLPFGTRIYAFYIDNTGGGESVVFIPTAGSLDTVNGNPVSYTFTFPVGGGSTHLLFCIAFRGNYIIRSFNQLGGSAVPGTVPTIQFVGDGSAPIFDTGAYVPGANYPDIGSLNSVFGKYTAVPTEIVPGMTGYFTYAPSSSWHTQPGFLCTHTGTYCFTIDWVIQVVTGNAATAAQSLGAYFAKTSEFNGTGTFVADHGISVASGPLFYQPSAYPPGDTVQFWCTYSTRIFITATAGNYYLPNFCVDTAANETYSVTSIYQPKLTIQYWADATPPVPAPLMMMGFSAPSEVTPLVAVQLSSQANATIQKALVSPAGVAALDPSSSVNQTPTFTLKDKTQPVKLNEIRRLQTASKFNKAQKQSQLQQPQNGNSDPVNVSASVPSVPLDQMTLFFNSMMADYQAKQQQQLQQQQSSPNVTPGSTSAAAVQQPRRQSRKRGPEVNLDAPPIIPPAQRVKIEKPTDGMEIEKQ